MPPLSPTSLEQGAGARGERLGKALQTDVEHGVGRFLHSGEVAVDHAQTGAEVRRALLHDRHAVGAGQFLAALDRRTSPSKSPSTMRLVENQTSREFSATGSRPASASRRVMGALAASRSASSADAMKLVARLTSRVTPSSADGRRGQRLLDQVASGSPVLRCGLVDERSQESRPPGIVVLVDQPPGPAAASGPTSRVGCIARGLVRQPRQRTGDNELAVARPFGQDAGQLYCLAPFEHVAGGLRAAQGQEQPNAVTLVECGLPVHELEGLAIQAGGVRRRQRLHGRVGGPPAVGDGLADVRGPVGRLPMSGQLRQPDDVFLAYRPVFGLERLGDSEVGALAAGSAELAVERVLYQGMGEPVTICDLVRFHQ